MGVSSFLSSVSFPLSDHNRVVMAERRLIGTVLGIPFFNMNRFLALTEAYMEHSENPGILFKKFLKFSGNLFAKKIL